MSNVLRTGLWMFKIGNLGAGNIVEPDVDGGRSLVTTGPESCATAQLPCPPSAVCMDYSQGFCCSCADGYFGNGRECLMKGMSDWFPIATNQCLTAFLYLSIAIQTQFKF